ncbi:hypothetical protein JTE90_026536 [Oedothorax gibbosus]|uniref:Uncharacterized protein n=1 Tax=Oedothorax gibbosus TaxID=931172 RepID=A0AAV6VQ66_9ARAC|nr:hypothetical protein JTE90_026536 [Oedothorax gibbosus]
MGFLSSPLVEFQHFPTSIGARDMGDRRILRKKYNNIPSKGVGSLRVTCPLTPSAVEKATAGILYSPHSSLSSERLFRFTSKFHDRGHQEIAENDDSLFCRKLAD